ncbi:hypothetical protein HDU96_009510 [Phlyctochytrium bullatum]|nr:hypothetical protein HDU96_009510 [Phlyctochytrium bullatum]
MASSTAFAADTGTDMASTTLITTTTLPPLPPPSLSVSIPTTSILDTALPPFTGCFRIVNSVIFQDYNGAYVRITEDFNSTATLDALFLDIYSPNITTALAESRAELGCPGSDFVLRYFRTVLQGVVVMGGQLPDEQGKKCPENPAGIKPICRRSCELFDAFQQRTFGNPNVCSPEESLTPFQRDIRTFVRGLGQMCEAFPETDCLKAVAVEKGNCGYYQTQDVVNYCRGGGQGETENDNCCLQLTGDYAVAVARNGSFGIFTPTSSIAPSANTSASGGGKSNNPLIIGITVPVVLLAIAAVIAVILVLRRKRASKPLHLAETPSSSSSSSSNVSSPSLAQTPVASSSTTTPHPWMLPENAGTVPRPPGPPASEPSSRAASRVALFSESSEPTTTSVSGKQQEESTLFPLAPAAASLATDRTKPPPLDKNPPRDWSPQKQAFLSTSTVTTTAATPAFSSTGSTAVAADPLAVPAPASVRRQVSHTRLTLASLPMPLPSVGVPPPSPPLPGEEKEKPVDDDDAARSKKEAAFAAINALVPPPPPPQAPPRRAVPVPPPPTTTPAVAPLSEALSASTLQVSTWSADKVAAWFLQAGFAAELVETLKQHRVNGYMLMNLSDEMMRGMGIGSGAARAMLVAAAQQVRAGVGGGAGVAGGQGRGGLMGDVVPPPVYQG